MKNEDYYYDEGYKAYWNNDVCPYDKDTKEAVDWVSGYNDAMFAESKLNYHEFDGGEEEIEIK